MHSFRALQTTLAWPWVRLVPGFDAYEPSDVKDDELSQVSITEVKRVHLEKCHIDGKMRMVWDAATIFQEADRDK